MVRPGATLIADSVPKVIVSSENVSADLPVALCMTQYPCTFTDRYGQLAILLMLLISLLLYSLWSTGWISITVVFTRFSSLYVSSLTLFLKT